MLEILALTQVFERRVYRHFTEHLRQANLHPVIATTLRRMLDEERGHLTWVKHWLDKQSATRPTEVREVMRRYADADELIYAAMSAEYGWRVAA
jgi:demethoxyubiquinone hydroxylase (CLK1/Coq7/Cat5 family)